MTHDESQGERGGSSGEVATQIKAARVASGLSCAQAAKLLGVSYAAMSSWEAGRRSPRKLAPEDVVARLKAHGSRGQRPSHQGAPGLIRSIVRESGISYPALERVLRVDDGSVERWSRGREEPASAKLSALRVLEAFCKEDSARAELVEVPHLFVMEVEGALVIRRGTRADLISMLDAKFPSLRRARDGE